jgi:hypothetical protein
MVNRILRLAVLVAFLLPSGMALASNQPPPPIRECVELDAIPYKDVWIPDWESVGIYASAIGGPLLTPLPRHDFYGYMISNSDQQLIIVAYYADSVATSSHYLYPGQELRISIPTRMLTVAAHQDFGSISICPPPAVDLNLSEVVDVAMYLTTEQVDAWKVESTTFPIFTGLAFFVTVFGVLSIIVAMMRLRWASDDAD